MKRTARPYPFVFVGHGPQVDYKCVECYLWLEKAPTAARARAIVKRIPKPLTSFARWDGPVLHFGSDDALEAYVRASYAPKYRGMTWNAAVAKADALYGKRDYMPTAKEWQAFGDALEAFGRAVHDDTPVRVLLRPSGESGHTSSPWHVWSVGEIPRMLREALPTKGKASNALTWAAALLMLTARDATKKKAKMTEEDRAAWLAFIDRVLPDADETAGGMLTRVALAPPFANDATFAKAIGPRARARLLALGGARAVEFFGEEEVGRAATQAVANAKPKNAAAARDVVSAAVTEIDRASPSVAVAIGKALLANRALAKGIAKLERDVFDEYEAEGGIAFEASPSLALYNKAASLQQRGELEQSCALLETALAFPHPIYWTYNNLILNYLNQKKPELGVRIADMPFVRKHAGPGQPELFHNSACVYAAVGRIDDALRDVELAKEHGCPTLRRMPKDADLRVLWKEPRFKKVFARE